jgi:hypothetical protein
VVQSLPFVAAVAIAALEGSRFNEFAFWRSIETRIAAALPRPAARARERGGVRNVVTPDV